MLNNSLAKLGKDYNVNTIKSIFPYKLATKPHLFYIGNTPNIHFYNDITDLDYIKLYKKDWSFKDETIHYLENDLNSLH